MMDWFIGVVEDRWDPEEMGRVRVRIVGVHSDDKSQVPTNTLPWATVMTPTTSPSVSEVATTPALLPGSWVVGFFHDGELKQDPIIMGSLPGKPGEKRSTDVGFTDPGGVYPRYINRADTPFEARSSTYTESSTYNKKKAKRVDTVPTATRPRITSVADDKADAEYELVTWDEFPVMNNHVPRYPFNHVRKSENGIVEEIDDTPGNTRYSMTHPAGTYEEVYKDGSRALHVEGYQNVFIKKGCNIFITGDTNLTVDGNMSHYVTGNYKLEVGGDYTRMVHGSMQTKVGKNDEREILMTRSVNIGVDDKLSVGQNKITNVGNDYNTNTMNDISFYTTGNHTNTVIGGNLTELVVGNYAQTNTGTLTVVSKGNILVETPASMTENITVNQTTAVGGTKTETAATGNVTYADGDVVASTISLTGHKHTGDSGGTTTKPIGA